MSLVIKNETAWYTLPLRQIITRLGKKSWRQTPRLIRIQTLSPSRYGKVRPGACLAAWDRPDGVAAMWLPPEGLTAEEFAYAADCMMRKGESPADNWLSVVGASPRPRVQVLREYEWARDFPMTKRAEKPKVIKEPVLKRRPTREQKLVKQLVNLDVQIARHEERIKHHMAQARRAETWLHKVQAERVSIQRKLDKERTPSCPQDSQ